MTSLPQSDRPASTSVALQVSAGIAALVLIALPATVFALRELAAPNLWFDESGQYWLAQGLHHFSPPNAGSGGWSKIVEYSRVFNSDPGGFTLLLRGWTALFGPSPLAIRTLPFVFFLLAPVVIFLAARRAGVNSFVAVLAASVPLGFPMLLHYATEIRAYSMETCAVAFLFFVPCWLQDEQKPRRLALLGGIAALLLTSRYSSYLFGAAACAAALFPLRPAWTSLRRFLCFSLPCLASVAAGYWIFARLQAGGVHRAPAYVEDFLLQGKTTAQVLARLHENFLSREALPITVYLVLAPVFTWFGPRTLAGLREIVGRTTLFCVLTIILTATGSLMGKLPWAFYTRWSIGYQALSACCLAMGVIVTGRCLLLRTTTWPWKTLAFVSAGGFSAIWGVEMNRAVHATRPYYESIASHLQTLGGDPRARDLRFFVQSGASPTVRYLCEVGPLKGAFSYPGNFHFESGVEANNSAVIAADQYDTVILTHFSLVETYRRRVKGTVELRSDPQPSCLLLLKN